MAREMSEHGAIGSRYLTFVGVLNVLLAHNAWLAGGWTGPAARIGKDEQPAALHLVPDEPTQIQCGHDAPQSEGSCRLRPSHSPGSRCSRAPPVQGQSEGQKIMRAGDLRVCRTHDIRDMTGGPVSSALLLPERFAGRMEADH
jgi:hypothetical protein